MDLLRFFLKRNIPTEGCYGEPEHLSLDNLLLQVAASNESRLLILGNNGHMGIISLQEGNIVDASFGDLAGEDALAAILSIQRGKYLSKEKESLPKGHINRPATVILHEIQLLLAARKDLRKHLPEAGQPIRLLEFPEGEDEEAAAVANVLRDGAVDLHAVSQASGLSRLRCEIILARLHRSAYLRIGGAPPLHSEGMHPELPDSAPSATPPAVEHAPSPEPAAGQPTGRRIMKKDPIKSALWGMIVGNIENMGIYPVLQGGEAIARSLDGGSALAKLAEIDGEDNYETTHKNGLTYVVIKSCPFTPIYKDIPPWGEKALKLVAAYNQKPDGGGALHPLCLVHKGIRNALKAGIISIACRSAAGKVEIAERSLEKAAITREEVQEMLEGKGCLFALREEVA